MRPPHAAGRRAATLGGRAPQARTTVVDWLKELGLFRGTAGNAMRLGLCSRSKDVIEPVLKPQWWVSCGGMAADACAAARDGRLRIEPRENEATWFRCGAGGQGVRWGCALCLGDSSLHVGLSSTAQPTQWKQSRRGACFWRVCCLRDALCHMYADVYADWKVCYWGGMPCRGGHVVRSQHCRMFLCERSA